jgi:hypothetical protein
MEGKEMIDEKMIDEIQRLLDERGVKYDESTQGNTTFFMFDYCDSCGDYMHNIAITGACISAYSDYLTPEQAIVATLGGGECENVAPDYLDFLCSVCGFVHYHSDENDTGDGNDWAYCPRCGKAVKR